MGYKMNTSEDSRLLTYPETVGILSSYGIPLARGKIAKSSSEASRLAAKIGYPVALKIFSPQVTHKTDAEALRLNLTNAGEVKEAFRIVIENARKFDSKAQTRGVLVQEMIRDGIEIIVGVSRDSQFGPVILTGIGGVLVEVFKDVSMRLPPITKRDAKEMMGELRGHELFEGFRGRPKADMDTVVEVLRKVSKMAIDLREQILELDLNPIIVGQKGTGAKVVDARIYVSKAHTG